MSDAPLPTDITDMLKRLGALDEEPRSELPVRFIVATDWEQAAVPLTMLKAFRAIVPAGSGLQLAFAVPGEPTASDAECVHVLADGAGSDLAGLEVLSFARAIEEPYDSAIVADGDPEALLAQVGGVIVRMHDVVRRLERAQAGTLADSSLNRGDAEALRRRLATFVG
ncbi:hypothetical protein BJY21_001029 [Kineosphaera limosa]|uniref:Uncharacterized protein n=1 Tax=Kineosphaera limosa NBRC 100340 TaxID=1184609 RepID=K6WUH1_9MICO|nr:hypothetical protein [Kineosphaera limosa]NYD99844.1 hypothetical protein [Kineosphaera limosa]GAB97481.1 hypothetical protein KILIM_070_00180 [Kineosphaera limosa NBRC 100340]